MSYPSFSEAYRQQQEQLEQKLLQIKEIVGQIVKGHDTVSTDLGAVSVAANTVREDLTTRRGRVLSARGHTQSADATLNAEGAIINPTHNDAVEARVELVDAQFGLDTTSEKLGLASRIIDAEGKNADELAREAAINGAAFKLLSQDIDEMLRLARGGRAEV